MQLTAGKNRRRRPALRAVVAGVAIVLVGTALVACGGGTSTAGSSPNSAATGGSSGSNAQPPEALIKAAQKEGTVNVYAPWTDQQADAINKAFSAEYGVTVNMTRLTSAPLNTRVVEEAKAGVHSVDVIDAGDTTIFNDDPKLFLNLASKSTDLPAMAQWPAKYAKSLYVDIGTTPYYIAYNASLVSQADLPKTWADLADPKYKGEVYFTDPLASPTISYLYYLIAQRSGEGDKFFTDLVKNGATVQESGAAAAQLVAAGEKKFFFPAVKAQLTGLPNMKVIMPPFTTGGPAAIAVMAQSPHPSAALLFANWLMTRDGAVAESGGPTSGGPSLLFTGIAGMPTLPAGFILPNFQIGNKEANDFAKALGVS